jgi:hypothetical protein
MRGTRSLMGALLIAGLAASPGWCAAADGPDSLATEALRIRLEHRSLARVTGPRGTVRLTDPRIGAAGLEFLAARPDEPTADTAAAVPNPIPLDQLSRVQIQVGTSRGVAIAGGLLGAVIGLSVANSFGSMFDDWGPPDANDSHSGLLLGGAVLGAVPGTLLGALLGKLFPHWKTIYPKTIHPEDPPLELSSP